MLHPKLGLISRNDLKISVIINLNMQYKAIEIYIIKIYNINISKNVYMFILEIGGK